MGSLEQWSPKGDITAYAIGCFVLHFSLLTFSTFIVHAMVKNSNKSKKPQVTQSFKFFLVFSVNWNSTAWQSCFDLDASGLATKCSAFASFIDLYSFWRLQNVRIKLMTENPGKSNPGLQGCGVAVLTYRPNGATYTNVTYLESKPAMMFRKSCTYSETSAAATIGIANHNTSGKLALPKGVLVWSAGEDDWSVTSTTASEIYADVGDVGIIVSTASGVTSTENVLLEVEFVAQFRELLDPSNFTRRLPLPPGPSIVKTPLPDPLPSKEYWVRVREDPTPS